MTNDNDQSFHEIVNAQAEIERMKVELQAYREGGVTEEILRRNGGYIKVGRGCAITLESDLPHRLHERITELESFLSSIYNGGKMYGGCGEAYSRMQEAQRFAKRALKL